MDYGLPQVMALCQAPFLLDDPKVGQMFPPDAIAKAKHYLAMTSGGVGAPLETQNFSVNTFIY
jgi:hypothetical protein